MNEYNIDLDQQRLLQCGRTIRAYYYIAMSMEIPY